MAVAAGMSMSMALIVDGDEKTRHVYDQQSNRMSGTAIDDDLVLPRADFLHQLGLFEDFGRRVTAQFQPIVEPGLALDRQETKKKPNGNLKFELVCGAPAAAMSELIYAPGGDSMTIKARPAFDIGFGQWLWWFQRIRGFYEHSYVYE